jgi:hypothetical protein
LANRIRIRWVNDMTAAPKIEGSLEISKHRTGIFIGGDPEALCSLARLLIWLADVDQNSLSGQPDGERCHVHLHTRDAKGFTSLTAFSSETELCRLDAKGTGAFPEKYRGLVKKSINRAKGKSGRKKGG